MEITEFSGCHVLLNRGLSGGFNRALLDAVTDLVCEDNARCGGSASQHQLPRDVLDGWEGDVAVDEWRMFGATDVRFDAGERQIDLWSWWFHGILMIWEVMAYEDVFCPLCDSVMKKLKI